MGFDLMDVFVKIGADTSELEHGIDKSKGLASGLGSALGTGIKAAGAAITAATTAVTAFAASSVNVGKTFDSSMSQVAATMGFTVEQLNATEAEMANMSEAERQAAETAQSSFNQLRDYAQEMGATTAFSATQAADALNYMALAGYDTEQSMAMLPNVLNLAAAGDMELARASDMVTDAASALGFVLEDGSADIARTTELVDQMARTSSKSNTSVSQLGDAILTIGGTAKNLAGGTIELNTALGILADNGIKGAEGGTHLRNAILSLSAPTDNAAAALEGLGVQTKDANGNLRPLQDIMGELGEAMDGLGTAERADIISTIFNKTDIAAVNALIDTNANRWNELAGEIDNAQGAAEAMAKTQLDNLAGDITLFKSALEGAQILVSDALTPSLREFVQFGTDGLTRVSDAFKEGGLSGAMEAFGDVLSDGLKMVINKLPSFIDAGMKLLEALGKGLLDNLPVIIDAAVQIIDQLVNGIVKALPALVQGGLQVITGLANGIAQSLPTLIPTIVQVVMQIIQTLYDNAPLLLQGGLNLIKGLAQGILNAIPVLIESLPTVITSMINYFVSSIPMLIEGAIQLVTMIAEALPDIITALVDALPQVIDAIVKGLITAAPLLIEGNIKLIMALVQALPQIIAALVEAIPQIIRTLVQTIINNGPAFLEAVVNICASILTAIVTYGGQFLSTMVTNLTELVTKVNEYLRDMLNKVVEWLSQLPTKMAYYAGYAIGQFIKFVAELPSKTSEIFTNVVNKTIEFGTNFANKAMEMAKNFFNNLVNGVKELPSKMAQLGTDLVNAIKDLPSRFAEIGSNIVQGIWKGISDGWNWLKDSVAGLAESLLQGAKDALGIESPSKEFAYVGRMVDEGFAKGITDYAGLVTGAMGNLIDIPNSFSVDHNGSVNGMNGGVGGYYQTINITSPTALSPYEIARQTRNATRDMVLAMSM